MSEHIISRLKENVIQGRMTSEDEGIDDSLTGGPGVVELTQQALGENLPVQQIVSEGLTAGMGIVGKKFNSGEYYVPDMLASAEAVSAAMDILKPHLERSDVQPRGTFAIATVAGDIHDIGKNIVSILIKGAGYDVVDLGIDVPTEKIVEYVREHKPAYLGLSALLTTTMLVMGEVIEALGKAGLRDQVRVFVGGAAVSKEYAEEIGADAYCADGFEAVRILESMPAA
ncbi:MAG: corrinoid protein [Syntrophales bacterium]|jgi:5-methyltetrahydrofolate--homocysteine methyltransferase|nr:corrinoid protein [Syntrophales bacterium]MCK9527048.1 corrinoid protein [Syntrophales bacterium]MDX9921827.1 corrinoid protein [Syntrophales bacterium]